MKKVNLLGIIFSLMFLWIIGQPLEAHAEAYTWISNGQNVSWYQGYIADETMKMDTAPSELTKNDYIYIEATPDEACSDFLANLSGEIGSVYIENIGDTNIILGNEDGSFVSAIHVSGGNVIFRGNTENATIGKTGNLTINGNAEWLMMGSLDYYEPATGTLLINGNVGSLRWVKQCDENVQCHCFNGNAEITGTVGSGTIEELCYDDTLERYVFAETGAIGSCEAGMFRITNGTLSNAVPVTNKEVTFEYYTFYQCHLSYGWMKHYYNKETGIWASQKKCSKEEIKAGDKVIIFSTDEPLIFDMDLSRLQVNSGDITFNGDIIEGEVKLPTDGLSISVPSNNEILNFRFTGTASNASISYSYNPNCDVYIDGKIDGTYWQDNKLQGYFECENVQLIKDGIWNKNVLIKTSLDDGALSYGTVDKETVEDAVADETIGQEIVDGDYTIYKDVETTIKQTTQDIIDSIAKADDFKEVLESIIEKMEETVEEVLDATPICAVDISIDSFYRDKNTGSIYTANPTYGKENISELPNGNTLEFSVKVPKAHYKEDAKYTIVRQHENTDGSVVVEQLETTQNGDMLTFESDKFSTFVIVEVTEKVDTTIEIKNADGTVVKTDGIFGDGTYSLENLTAGTYTVKVARENYVSRTYTIEIEEDSEIVEIEVKLHKLGDITGDGVINARDKKTLFNHIAGTSKLTDYAFEVADVNGDGVINARDKKMVFNHIAGTNSLWR